MALIRTFHTRNGRSGEIEIYSLARDVTTDRVFILKTTSSQAAADQPDVEIKIPIGLFLTEKGAAQDDLVQLVGSLVPEIWLRMTGDHPKVGSIGRRVGNRDAAQGRHDGRALICERNQPTLGFVSEVVVDLAPKHMAGAAGTRAGILAV